MTQAELDAGTPIDNTATVTGDGAAPDNDDATVAVAQNKSLHIEKDATVADGTADSTSDVINYTLTVTNQGNAAIANVVVDDPFTTDEAPVLSGGFNAGDTDQDNLLDVGETWQYTASHQVTQAELDAGAALVNVATATRHRGGSGRRRRDGGGDAEQVAEHREGRRCGVGGRPDDVITLHDGGDQYGQCGDCRCGGHGRSSRPTRRRC